MRRRVLLAMPLVGLAQPALIHQAWAQAGVVFPPGSAVGLKPMAGMVAATGFTGFANQGAQASILLAELPAEAYAGLSTLDEGALLQRQGITVTARRTVSLPAGPGVLLRGTQRAGAGVVVKHILILGTPALTALATFQAPDSSTAYTAAAVDAALLTTTTRPAPPLAEKVRVLPFVLRDLAGFRVVRTLAGTGVALTEGPLDVAPDAEQPLVVVQRQYGPYPTGPERAGLARARFAAAAGMRAQVVGRDEALGADGWLLDATGPDARTEAPRYALQVIRLVPGGILQLLAIARAEGREALAPRLLRMAAGMAAR